MEKGLASIRDVLHPPETKMKELREALFAKITPRNIVREIFHGVAYIHSNTDKWRNRISHCDIKPENILIFLNKRDGSFVIKISDFDSSVQSLEMNDVVGDDDDDDDAMSVEKDDFLQGEYCDANIVSKRVSKEPLDDEDYVAHDVYACAMVGFEILVGDGTRMFTDPGGGNDPRATHRRKMDNDRYDRFNELVRD